MDAILQTTYSNGFSWKKIFVLIQISLEYVPKGRVVDIGSGDGFVPNRSQVIAWMNVYHFFFILLGLNDLKI